MPNNDQDELAREREAQDEKESAQEADDSASEPRADSARTGRPIISGDKSK